MPWQEVRQSVDVKLLTRDAELCVLVRSERRVLNERSMRRRRLKKLWKRLGELGRQSNRRDQLMLKLGAAKKDAGRAWFLVEVQIPKTDEELAAHGLTYRLRREKLRQVFRREGRYLLRSNMTSEDPAELWRHYMQLTEIEQAFRSSSTHLAIRPIFHQLEERSRALMHTNPNMGGSIRAVTDTRRCARTRAASQDRFFCPTIESSHGTGSSS